MIFPFVDNNTVIDLPLEQRILETTFNVLAEMEGFNAVINFDTEQFIIGIFPEFINIANSKGGLEKVM